MICFRDTTYCSSPTCQDKCGRKPPEDLEAQVLRWWGKPGGPVAYADFCSEINNGEKVDVTDI